MEQASCLFLRMVQDVRLNASVLSPVSLKTSVIGDRQPPSGDLQSWTRSRYI
ncbi:MAG: hypothetical protein JGK17_12555 [Microcoleus sp. PH2017_10_PVI_O_A]|uniref:hypothetical protein n=1 Tax=unclassified Microcoleus TaxID=2642155 RepID=UPI001E123B4D|nr:MULTISPECIES: hypothetical protein [unclassified Microcoleus]MCC3406395.1 hypothetical protein [Microcoleus sp. PH2017_10_PVI_O_A]MCC3459022.1 hypothetical protein [Microcoleus sp. PH2017_11_PCY_U_A]MCC3477853.1 hypothetical protein [Microcoleus sp. PH2017_12_PCY_D_A]MCC3527796.1 hypothetical protein [Microcoleus sp. PH2017_21_RUC_O_A]MCC3539811.1 hypothetical protein [Microcoleus sp. PH2017_22_RUC_O_B]